MGPERGEFRRVKAREGADVKETATVVSLRMSASGFRASRRTSRLEQRNWMMVVVVAVEGVGGRK